MLPTPVAMKKITLTMMDVDAQQAANTLARLEILHPLQDHETNNTLPEFPVRPFYEVYHSVRSRYAKIRNYQKKDVPAIPASRDIVTLEQLTELDHTLKQVWMELSNLEEELRRLKEKTNNQRQVANSLQKFSALDLDLSRLHRSSNFLEIMVGTVPSHNKKQLKQALSLANFVMHPFHTAQGNEYVIIVGPATQKADVEDLLQSADFRVINVPEEFAGSPTKMQANLDQKLTALTYEIETVKAKMMEVLANNAESIARAAHLLVMAKPYASLDNVLKGKGGLVSLQGWIPAEKSDVVASQLKQDLSFPFHLELSDPVHDEFESVPTLLKHNRFMKPFESLVNSFGIPSYTEIDPTHLFTLTYILMFGMMFGDVGHGLVIALGSLFLWRSYPSVTIVAVMAGCSSAFFGLVYGSIFGYEHVIHPLWMSPMEDPEKVLLIAVSWGAFFILVVNLLAIRNALVIGDKKLAFYSGRGLTGLCFYLALIYVAYELMVNGVFGWMQAVLLAVPMAVILQYQWGHSSGSISERILVVSIEGLEHLISTLSGTLSFLRVAAFSLNHIALAAAVFSIAGMLDIMGHWIAIILGNIFIIVLEGAIVAIQCLRLEYYEGFSRFFEGKGKSFQPLKL